MTVIGLTGGTGAGKTSALNVLLGYGAVIFDCDEIYHGLLSSSEPMQREICGRFGMDFSSGFDRKELGKLVFGDKKALDALNEITHKYVIDVLKNEIKKAEENGTEYAAIDAIALVESGAAKLCDFTVAVTAPPKIRAKRIMERENIDLEYAMARIKSQKNDEFFRENCDYVLINDCASLNEFEKKCEEFFTKKLKER